MCKIFKTLISTISLFTLFFGILVEAQPAGTRSPKIDDAGLAQLHSQGVALLRSGRPEEAISKYFDKLNAVYSARYKDSQITLYSARSKTEELFYLLKAAEGKKEAKIIPSTWAETLYHRGYALIELRRYAEAKASIEQALKLSPHNAQYLSEMGHIYSLEKNWTKAIETYELSADAAGLSPDKFQVSDRTRAWRGIGYAYVELGRLDEAQAMYEKCLALDPKDRSAQEELAYVRSARAKSASSVRE